MTQTVASPWRATMLKRRRGLPPEQPASALPWICPSCYEFLGAAEMTQTEAQRTLVLHMEVAHKVNWADTPVGSQDDSPSSAGLQPSHPSLPDQSGAPKGRLIPCPKCGVKVYADRMELHFSNYCPPVDTPPRIATHHLPFRVLPPGTWDINQVIAHYRRMLRDFSTGPHKRDFDQSRLERIRSLDPVECWTGTDAWSWYHVFIFAKSDRVVLECPFQGNATYVLWGDWKQMVSHTKAEIRREYRNRHEKIIHSGDWLNQVRRALHNCRH